MLTSRLLCGHLEASSGMPSLVLPALAFRTTLHEKALQLALFVDNHVAEVGSARAFQ